MLEEDGSAFQSGFAGFFVFAIKDPTKTTVAKVGDNSINNSGDSAADGAASVAADGLTDGGDATADLAEDTFNDTGDGEVSGNGGEALFHDFFTGANDVFREFSFDDAFGHHSDLAGFVAVRNKAKHNDDNDEADNDADAGAN